MTQSAVIGSGLQLDAGDHACAFYRTPAERDEILLPFLIEGVRAGDKCVCVVDSCPPEVVLERVVDEVGALVREGQLEVLDSEGTYFADGGFLPDRMLSFWNDKAATCLAEGDYTFVRNIGDMTWAHKRRPGVNELATYESELNRFMAAYPQVNLCLYDLTRCSGELALDVLKTHPKVLMGGMVLENPYFLEPDEFLAARRRKSGR